MVESGSAKPASTAINVGALQVAAIYAKAFLGASEKSGQTDQLVNELGSVIHSVLDPFPQFETVLSSALVSAEEKAALLERVLGGKVSAALLDFLKVVSRKGRLDILRAIHHEVTRLYDEMRGRVRVQVRTASAIDGGVSNGLSAALTKLLGGQPVVDAAVDPGLIGGVVLRVGDTVYDGSVARQLEQVREQMITRSIHEIQSRRDSFRHSGGN